LAFRQSCISLDHHLAHGGLRTLVDGEKDSDVPCLAVIVVDFRCDLDLKEAIATIQVFN
jgi:hypothetical protein